MAKTFETLRLDEPQADTLLVTLNRPEVGNAMNTRMGIELLDLWDGINADPARHRCIVLTGAGERIFCAGGDLKERNGMTDAQWQAQHLIFERGIRALLACPVPVIAAVNGAAYAGGCEISLCCDFIYASETARFALTEVTLGIMPGAGGTQNLPRAAGARRAKEILLTGKPFTAREAVEWGVVNRLCPPESLDRAGARHRARDRRQRAALDAADQAVGQLRPQHGSRQRDDVRDRGVQPPGAERGSPRGRAGLQREAQAEFPGTVIAMNVMTRQIPA